MSLLYHIINILFPKYCFYCGKVINEKDEFLCPNCFSKIPINKTLFCSVCSARLPENKLFCHKNNSYLLGAAVRYEEIIKKIIWLLKYNKKLIASRPLLKIMLIYLDNLKINFQDFIVLPIPLHPQKQHQRGFNQSQIIAQAISEKFNLQLINNCLIKIKNTSPQMEISDWEKRQVNIADSFQIKQTQFIRNKNILLIDDVTTSGSTFNEAVKTLKASGAKKIIALAIAKAT